MRATIVQDAEMADGSEDEVALVIRRWFAAFAGGDVNTLLNLFHDSPDFFTIGTDPLEWWAGDHAREVWRAQMTEMAGTSIELRDLKTWVRDKMAWVAVSSIRYVTFVSATT